MSDGLAESSQRTLLLSVPLPLPSPERIEEIIREAATLVAAQQLAWLDYAQAALHLGIAKRTFERKLKVLGIPVAEIDGIRRVARQDLDAVMRAHLTTPGRMVINFPSMEQREKERAA